MDFGVQSLYSLDEHLQCFNISLRREILRGILKNISQGETLKGEELRDLFGSRGFGYQIYSCMRPLTVALQQAFVLYREQYVEIEQPWLFNKLVYYSCDFSKQIEVQSIEISETTKLCQLQMDTSHSFQLITYWIKFLFILKAQISVF